MTYKQSVREGPTRQRAAGSRQATPVTQSFGQTHGRICRSWSCVKQAKKRAAGAWNGAKRVADAGVQIAQEIPYGAYYVSYTALDQANRNRVPVPVTIRGALVAAQVVGLAGDAAIDKARGKSIWDDARRDSAPPNFVAKRWNPRFLYGYLPGMGYDSRGKKKIDLRF